MAEKPSPKSPVVLDLAPLPRDQIGPFLILGVEKTADKEQIESSWAKRIIWARKKQIGVPLEDINWAREMLSTPDKRIAADAASLNLDTTDGALKNLAENYASSGTVGTCQPVDEEKELADYAPPLDVPDVESVRQAIKIPDIPREYPVVRHLLEEFARKEIDPWSI